MLGFAAFRLDEYRAYRVAPLKRPTALALSSETAACDMGCPCAGSQREVDEIVTDYLGGGKQVGQSGTEVTCA